MRTLKFNVNKLDIDKDPDCILEGLVPGTEGYLQTEFSFSKEWDGCVKVAAFYDGIKEYPVVLEGGKSCMIPSEVTKRHAFGVRVLGKREGYKIATNKYIIAQRGR